MPNENPFLERMDVDHVEWGKLIKSWATGKSYFVEGQPAPPLPETLEQLKTICQQAGFQIRLPGFLSKIQFVKSDADTLTVRLPPKAILLAREEAIVNGSGEYPLPPFYDKFYGRATRPLEANRTLRLDVHAGRIGDYSIGMCG